MKRALFLFFLLSVNLIFSQNEYAFTLENENGEVINDLQTLEFNSVEYEDASFEFFILGRFWPVLAVLDRSRPFWTVPVRFGPFLAVVDALPAVSGRVPG